MEEPQIVERGKGRTGRLRNRNACGYVGVARVPFFVTESEVELECGKDP